MPERKEGADMKAFRIALGIPVLFITFSFALCAVFLVFALTLTTGLALIFQDAIFSATAVAVIVSVFLYPAAKKARPGFRSFFAGGVRWGNIIDRIHWWMESQATKLLPSGSVNNYFGTVEFLASVVKKRRQ